MGDPRDMNPSPQPFPPYVEDTKVYDGGKATIENYKLDDPLPAQVSGMCPHGPWEDVTPEVTSQLRGKLELFTPAELAAALGVKEETLTVWRGSGAGPDYVKLGKKVFYRLGDLNWWVSTRMPEKKSLPMQPLPGVDDADAETKVEVLNPDSPWGKPVDAITAHERAMPPKTTGL